ncbi:menaquinone biosynthesis decarboxylase [Candidatus Sumerlaeota bacterium]|nr:menaquinone biosynthesis decarboxylase [Candidatus Sumerlaeota bacterium]
MPFKNLRDWIAALDAAGDLRRIEAEVDPHLEITAFADKAVKSGGPALLFEKPRRSCFPVAINLFGSERRVNGVLGTDQPSEIADRYLALLDRSGPMSILDKIKMLPRLAEIGHAMPRTTSGGAPCQEATMAEPSFDPFPILKCWPQDGGPTLTLPMVFTRDPETGHPNCGMYRMQVYDSRTSGMHWHVHKGGADHWRKARARGERLPVAVALGGPPLATFAAMCPLPPDLDEMLFAGLAGGEPIEMVRCTTCDILVPAESEIVFEGYVEPDEMRTEGPFGDHTGFYSLADEYPVFHLTAVTHRRDPIYPATVVGRPPMEDGYMGRAVEELFRPLLRMQLPEVVDFHMPFAGVFHNLLLVSIRKAYPGHARKAMHALWGLGQMMFSKVIVVLDHDVNLRDYNETVWKALNHIDPERDMEFVLGPVDALDHASRLPHYGSHVGIDATRKWKEEGFDRPWPDEMRLPEEVIERVERLWREMGAT